MTRVVQLRPRRGLTRSQELIWTSQRIHPDVPLANMATVSHIEGPIDPERFVEAVDRVVRGSDALRMIVREIDGMPHPTVRSEPPVGTLRIRIPADDLDDWMRHRISSPIDISDSVYDSVLIEHEATRWSWWMNIHHIATDAGSSAQIFRAVSDAYHGEWSPPMPYHELAKELDALHQTTRWERAVQYWHEVVQTAEPTELYAPDAGADTRAERTYVEVQGQRERRLRSLLADRFRLLSPDLSLTVALATALASYLHRLSGSERITIGIPVHNRSTRHAKSVIGPLVELFPLVVEVEVGDTFATLQQRVARNLMTLLGKAQPGSSPRQTFDLVLNVHGATFGAFGAMPTRHRWIHPGHIDSHHRLRVQALDYSGDGTLELALDINHRTAGPDHRKRADQHFAAVLDAMLADPDRDLRTVRLITPDELLLMESVTNPDVGTPLDAPAPDLIARQLRTLADRTVISHGDLDLSATVVEGMIDRVARTLSGAGIGRGDRVGIEMPISVDAVVAIHGVLRCGAAFVPIDPAYPDARRDFLRSDSGVRLTLRSLADLETLVPVRLSTDAQAIDLDDLAYVLYTSGSTGLPKGVPISHRGLAEYLGFAHGAYVDGAPPVMPLYTSLSFDLTITTLFLPWLAAGELTIHPDGGLQALREIVDDSRATLLKATPSHLELLVRMVDADHPLRSLIVGGEAFMTDLADQMIDVLGPDLAIFNEYGPTEAVVGCMIHRYDPESDPGPEVPIGSPAPGVGLHVLDTVGHPVPMGAVGELYVHRAGMATEYLGRPELTARQFLDNNLDPGTTLYRTGDRVRMLDADRMVYLGRLDDQIKVGGVRVEPGAIEAAAKAVPGVHRAVAALWKPDPAQSVEQCVRCGLGSNVPNVTMNADGVCSVCLEFDLVAPRAAAWFRSEDDLRVELEEARRRSTGHHDVLHLLSGGKDSTYALYRLVEMGARVRALTLDNGFISHGAKENIRRAVESLGVDHEFVTVDGMNDIFRDSLQRFSNVCNGCYKAIYTVALERADRLGIPAIVTGLSRGQFFETRLVPGLFGADRFDPDAIDEAVDQARRVYHSTRDAVSEHLDVEFLEDGRVLDQVTFVDFYRYVDVELSEMYDALERSGTWIRPVDTGRSTNCLINTAGIHVHQLEQSHHNYALPYSWDVRLGHKTRDEALHELDDPMDAAELDSIAAMLAEVGYEPRPMELLTLWIEADATVDIDALRDSLAETLPPHAQPQAIERVDSFPLTSNGKVDVGSLPMPTARRTSIAELSGRASATATEAAIAAIWETTLGLASVSATDDFFTLGGTSLHALEMIVRVSEDCGVNLPESMAFQHRTVEELAAIVDRVAGADGEHGERPPSGSVIPDVGDTRPLSAGEEALLFEWRRDPTDVRYNVGRLYRLPVTYDRDRFDDAVRTVVAHQPVLHTSYGSDRRLLDVDEALRIGERSSSHESIDDIVAELHAEPFDLVHGPLITVQHIRSTLDDRPAVMIRTHHISSDAGSLDILWTHIDLAYRGEPLPELDTTYAAHGAWQRDRSPNPADAWPADSLLVGNLALCPTADEPDGYVERRSGLSTGSLRAAPGTTAVTTALTALAAAIAPFHDRRIFEIAVAASTRDHSGLEHVAGYFTNPLPLLLDVDPSTNYRDLADSVGDVLASGLSSRTVPFAAIARDARERGAPVPQSRIMLSVQDFHEPQLDGEPIEHRVLFSGVSVNDLTFFLLIRGDTIDIGCEYRGTAVSRSHASLLLEQFELALVELSERPLVDIDRLTPRPPLLRGAQLVSAPTFVPDRIAHTCETRPDNLAVRGGNVSITYADLDHRARSVAARLRSVGIASGDRVVIVLPRSVDQPVAIMAVWLLGGSYVPIDVSQPAARVAELVAASGAAAAITSGDGHPGLREVATVRLDADDAVVLPISRRHDTHAEDEAYVIFTSGSTGRPKGVPISHGNLAASVAARLDWYDAPAERYLLLSSLGFDSSVAGLFWVLSQGGELIIPTEVEVHDVDALLALITEHQPTHTLCVPSLYSALLRRHRDENLGFRTVVVAGEACPPELVDRHFAAGSAELVNEYGPTEATVWAVAHRCRPEDSWASVPIGLPIPGVATAVVRETSTSSSYAAAPIDVAGELWISGPTVSVGYVGVEAPDRFVTAPDGVRWYRTGDRVVRRADDVLEFMRRVDAQLSIGGVRIEPAEIELALTSIPGVRAALVADRSGQLRGWIESDDDQDGTSLVALLGDRLAPTHVPRSIVVVDTLPRNVNGKVDRSRTHELPDPVSTVDRAVDGSTEPSSASDRVLGDTLAVFSDAFDNEPVSAESDFFAMGGDSLRAVVLVTLLEQRFGRRIGIGELVDAPTPARMAARLRVQGEAKIESDRAAARLTRETDGLVEWLRSSGSERTLVLLPPGGGNLLRYAPLVRAIDAAIPVVGLRLPGADSRTEIAHTIEDQAAVMLAALDTAVSSGPYRLLGWSTGGLIAWEMAHLLNGRGDEVELVALVDTFMGGMHVQPDRSPVEKYRELLDDEGARAVAFEAFGRIRERADFALARRRYRHAREKGVTPELTDAERQLGPVIRRAALDYSCRPLDVPAIYFSASESIPEMTVDPWVELHSGIPSFRVVTIEGVHFEPEERCIIGPDRVGELVAELDLDSHVPGAES